MTSGYGWIVLMPRPPCYAHTRFLASVIVLEVVSSEGHIIGLNFFQQGLWSNAAGYIEVLETIVIDLACN